MAIPSSPVCNRCDKLPTPERIRRRNELESLWRKEGRKEGRKEVSPPAKQFPRCGDSTNNSTDKFEFAKPTHFSASNFGKRRGPGAIEAVGKFEEPCDGK